MLSDPAFMHIAEGPDATVPVGLEASFIWRSLQPPAYNCFITTCASDRPSYVLLPFSKIQVFHEDLPENSEIKRKEIRFICQSIAAALFTARYRTQC